MFAFPVEQRFSHAILRSQTRRLEIRFLIELPPDCIFSLAAEDLRSGVSQRRDAHQNHQAIHHPLLPRVLYRLLIEIAQTVDQRLTRALQLVPGEPFARPSSRGSRSTMFNSRLENFRSVSSLVATDTTRSHRRKPRLRRGLPSSTLSHTPPSSRPAFLWANSSPWPDRRESSLCPRS